MRLAFMTAVVLAACGLYRNTCPHIYNHRPVTRSPPSPRHKIDGEISHRVNFLIARLTDAARVKSHPHHPRRSRKLASRVLLSWSLRRHKNTPSHQRGKKKNEDLVSAPVTEQTLQARYRQTDQKHGDITNSVNPLAAQSYAPAESTSRSPRR